jgi:CHAD domain-containing protein
MASYRILQPDHLTDEVRRIATDQVERGLADLDGDDPNEGVHQVRKRCKKFRALMRLVRDADAELYQRENAAFRDIARRASHLRDDAAMVEAYDELAAAYADHVDLASFTPVRDALVARRDDAAPDVDDALAAMRSDLEAARGRIATWELPGDGFELLAGGLERTYRRSRDRHRDAYADGTTEAFHEWRKRVKYHRYQVRLLQDAWPAVLKARRQELHTLGELLGDDHDLAVLRARLHAEPEEHGGTDLVAAITGLLDRRRATLQVRADHLGARMFAEKPGAFVERIGTYWEAWAADRSGDARLAAPAVPSTAGSAAS